MNVNQTSEECIREELQKELSTKDNNIRTMCEQVQELKADNETLNGNNKQLNDKIQEATKGYLQKNEEWMQLVKL